MKTYALNQKVFVRFFNREPHIFVDPKTSLCQTRYTEHEAWHNGEIVKITRTKITVEIPLLDCEMVFNKQGQEIKPTIFGATIHPLGEAQADFDKWEADRDAQNARLEAQYQEALSETMRGRDGKESLKVFCPACEKNFPDHETQSVSDFDGKTLLVCLDCSEKEIWAWSEVGDEWSYNHADDEPLFS